MNLNKKRFKEATKLTQELGHTDIPTKEFFNKLGFTVQQPYRKHFIQDLNEHLKQTEADHLTIRRKDKGNPPRSTILIRNTEMSYADRAIKNHQSLIDKQRIPENFYREYINRENQTITALIATTYYLLNGGKKKHVAQDYNTTATTMRKRIKELADMDYAPYPLQEKAQQELQEKQEEEEDTQ